MKKFKLKGAKGITLIALVITIIVMLILAGVTISMAVNGGLFGYAGNAAEQTKTARDEEQNLANLKGGMTTDQLIAKYTNSKEADLKELQKFFIDDHKDAFGSDAENKGIMIIGGNYNVGWIALQYNDNFYKVTYEYNDDESGYYAKKVDAVEGDAYNIMGNGTYLGMDRHGNAYYYKYNNKRYRIVENANTGKLSEEEYTPTKEVTDFEDSIRTYQRAIAFFELYEYEDMEVVSNNENIAKVTNGGMLNIQGISIGEATITLTGLTSGKTKNVTVNVGQDPYTSVNQ